MCATAALQSMARLTELEKPEVFYQLVEELSPGPYLELAHAGHR